MLFAYLKIARRVILKHKGIHCLNIIGLSMGLTVSLILGAYCINEYEFDRFNKNAQFIYRLWATIHLGANEGRTGQFSFQTADELKKNIQVTEVVRIRKLGSALVKNANNFLSRESGIIFSGPSLFSVFTFPVISGSAQSLINPNAIMLSESMAARYFHDENPLGKILTYNDSVILEVEGVFSNVPQNSTLRFDFVVSENILPRLMKSLPGDDRFGPGSYETYVLLDHQADPKSLSSSLPEQTVPFKIGEYHFESLVGMHIRDYEGNQKHPFAIFAIVAIVLLVVATINFINISITLNVERSKEIIVRKINGASRYSIIVLFYTEVLIITVISVAISFVMANLAMGFFESVLSINIDKTIFLNARFVWLTIAGVILIVAVGGSYPVMVLSNTQPVPVLTSVFSRSRFANHTAHAVMAAQFAVSTALVMCIVIVNSQLNYMQKDDLGINVDNVITFRMDNEDARRYSSMRNDLLAIAGVENVGAADVGLFQETPPITTLTRADSSVTVPVSIMIVDTSFFSTLEIGQSSHPFRGDGLVLNNAAAREFLINRDPKGISLKMGPQSMPITGIVNDFNFVDKKHRVGSLVMTIADDSSKVFSFTGCNVYLRMSQQAIPSTLTAIRIAFQRHFPGRTFRYDYVKDKIETMYNSEHGMLRSFTLFAVIGIIISLFGVIGLMMFNIAEKMGSLTVRKLLGANTSQLSYFLSKEVARVTILGMSMGALVSYYFLNDWLNTFAYRISIGPHHILVCFALIAISAVIVSAEFIRRAINTNPVAFLRKE